MVGSDLDGWLGLVLGMCVRPKEDWVMVMMARMEEDENEEDEL